MLGINLLLRAVQIFSNTTVISFKMFGIKLCGIPLITSFAKKGTYSDFKFTIQDGMLVYLYCLKSRFG